MPASTDAYARYKHIDYRLRLVSKPAPTLEMLVAYVSQKLGKAISVRTLQNDIYQMRYSKVLGYKAPIEYNRKTRTYQYSDPNFTIDSLPLTEEDLVGLSLAIKVLQQYKSLPALKQFSDAIARIATTVNNSQAQASAGYLQLDSPRQYDNIAYLQPIVDCINERRVLKLKYKSFNKNEAKDHIVHPYFVKEYRSRLYLVANDIAPGKMPKLLLFAFDRITHLRETYEHYKPQTLDQENYFKHTLGVGFSSELPQQIRLRFSNAQAPYVRTQPIHHSQKIEKETDTYIEISLYLVLNVELKMKILEFGKGVEVLSPQSLRDEVAAELLAAAQQYTKKR